ncbi:hypothetical protein WH47_10207 [Habropoda laboriosa]|uniref:Histone-lysine N-methyltransferase SETMAR n=1 Tax=Habropoda laboriosa TaxID=597456 RepID=A0A0L7R4D7_9HYME|nr:hypothetical protein WH47_10207 [Habropoda laboriosa]
MVYFRINFLEFPETGYRYRSYSNELEIVHRKLKVQQPALVNRKGPILLHDYARPARSKQKCRKIVSTGYMGNRNEGSAGRSHREPPRWFTARRKLVKFKSAFKTGLARCPVPPGAATAGKRYRRAPTGVHRSNILGKLWMDFPPQAASFHQPRSLLPSQQTMFHSNE